MTETDLSDWLTVLDAAAQIGCSKRTVERLGQAKQLEQRLRPQKGSPAVAVYNPDDVARIAAARRPEPPPFVLEAERDIAPRNGQGGSKLARSVALSTSADDDPIRQFVAALVRVIQSPPSPPIAETVAESRLVLTIPEAAAVSGFSQAYLRRQCQKGWSGAIKDGTTWKIRRRDLEAL